MDVKISLITKSIFLGKKKLVREGKGTRRALSAMLSSTDKQKLAAKPKQQFCHYRDPKTLEIFFLHKKEI